MAGIGKAAPISTDPAVRWLDGQTKAALIDMLIEVLRTHPEHTGCDDPIYADLPHRLFAGVLARRKGKKPPMATWNQEKS